MKSRAATLLLGVVLPSALPASSHACSGTALATTPGGFGYAAIVRGQHYDDFDHLLRRKADGQVVVCAEDRCYPAIVVDNGQATETMRLQGCRIAATGTDDHGLERHDMDTPGFDRTPDQGDETPDGDNDDGSEPD